MTDAASLAYGNPPTEGHSGTDTSRERALTEAVNGVAAARQRYLLILAANAGEKGITVAEARESNGKLHHGSVSASLTGLHIAGRLERLTAKRGKCRIYVLPQYVNDRETDRPRRNRHLADPEVLEAADQVERWAAIAIEDQFLAEHMQTLIGYARGER